jgi:multiple sugar transport system substrate-binding protein
MTDHRARRLKTPGISLLLLVAVAACQPAAPQPRVIASIAAEPRPTGTAQPRLHPVIPEKSLKGVGIQIWHPFFGVEASLLESQVAEFNKENDWGITIRASGKMSFTEQYSALAVVLPGTEAPQLVIALPEEALSWDARGYVIDLTDYVGDPVYGLSAEDQSDFPPAFWRQDVIAGRRLGVPAQRSANFVIYNQSWARQLGFKDAPQTEVEFREQACAAHEALALDDNPANDGKGGWLVDTNAMTFLSWMMAFGGGALEGSGYRFLSPRNLEAAAFVKQLYDDACAWMPQDGDLQTSAFAGRKALFATAGLGELPEFRRAMAAAENADAWTVMSFPGPKQTGLAAYGSSFVVLKSTPEEQLASWLFIRWLLSAQNQRKWVEATGLFPLRSSVRGLVGEYARSHPQWAAAVEYIPEAQTQPQLASWRQIRTMLGDGFDAMFRSNTPAGRVAEILAIMDRTASDLSQ